MDQNRIKIGMKVKIVGIRTTHERHSSCSQMERMIGKVWTVKKILDARAYASSQARSITEGTKTITFYNGNDYVWAPEDLQCVSPKPIPPKKVTFNPDNIVRMV